MPSDDLLYDPGADSPRSELDSDDDLDRPGPSRGRRGAGGSSKEASSSKKGKGKDSINAWEATYKRSWDEIQEDEQGGLQSSVDNYVAQRRRKRCVSAPHGARSDDSKTDLVAASRLGEIKRVRNDGERV